MSPQRLIRTALLLPTLIASAFMLKLVAALFVHALAAGPREALLMVWLLAFLLGVPVLIVLLSLAATLRSWFKRPTTIPLVGVKIPELGQ